MTEREPVIHSLRCCRTCNAFLLMMCQQVLSSMLKELQSFCASQGRMYTSLCGVDAGG